MLGRPHWVLSPGLQGLPSDSLPNTGPEREKIGGGFSGTNKGPKKHGRGTNPFSLRSLVFTESTCWRGCCGPQRGCWKPPWMKLGLRSREIAEILTRPPPHPPQASLPSQGTRAGKKESRGVTVAKSFFGKPSGAETQRNGSDPLTYGSSESQSLQYPPPVLGQSTVALVHLVLEELAQCSWEGGDR